jgi:hypothetical protein
MKIPVFVSCPTDLSAAQDASRRAILRELDRLGLEPRAIGRSDYPTELPLREVLILARHCAGGLILGFTQFQSKAGVSRPGTKKEKKVSSLSFFPSPWNHLEAGILFGLQLPLLVFREEGVEGGIFDIGVTDVFIHKMPPGNISGEEKKGLAQVFLKWQGAVRAKYYGSPAT